MGSYIRCTKKEAPKLAEKAKGRAAELLAAMGMFFKGDIRIEVRTKQNLFGCSIGGALLVGGEVAKEYEYINLLFIDVKRLILGRMCFAQAVEQAKTTN